MKEKLNMSVKTLIALVLGVGAGLLLQDHKEAAAAYIGNCRNTFSELYQDDRGSYGIFFYYRGNLRNRGCQTGRKDRRKDGSVLSLYDRFCSYAGASGSQSVSDWERISDCF